MVRTERLPINQGEEKSVKPWSRRTLLKTVGSLALASALPRTNVSLAGMWSQLFGGFGREVSPITPNDEFYITSYRSPPDVWLYDWSLAIKGLVQTPLNLTYQELVSRPSLSEIVTLECVGNGVADESIGTAEWEGVSLKALLDEVGVESSAYDVVLRAADGYSDSFLVERAMTGDVLVAYKMNGVSLPPGHGYPARIIIPGVYGMKHVQWLTEIELVDHDYQGYYQKQGWSDDAKVQTMSWITDPQDGDELPARDYLCKGFAFAGTRGIRSVELSMDGGETWRTTELEPALSPYSWVFWKYRWLEPRPGVYRILVRAIDGTGEIQSDIEKKPFPSGSTGLLEISVTVSG